MGVADWLARAAVQAPHLLLVESPGGWSIRVSLEQEIARRGWRVATSPADADVLAVCGDRLPDDYAEALDRTWAQMPGPRARIHLVEADPKHICLALDRAVTHLLDHRVQQADAASRDRTPGEPDAPEHPPEEDGHTDHGTDDAGMDHGHMDMGGPGGIPLASGGSDRDGLDMDVLHLRLGPVLPHWPAGLVVDVSLQGDLVTEATVGRLPEGGASRVPGRMSAARRCDAAAAVLWLAGANRLAAMAAHTRDLLLDPVAPVGPDSPVVDLLVQHVHRSWPLRWSLRDLARGRDAAPSCLRGDVYDRLLRVLEVAADETRTQAPSPDCGDVEPWAVIVPDLLVGSELATARLAVASVTGLCAPLPQESHGPAHG